MKQYKKQKNAKIENHEQMNNGKIKRGNRRMECEKRKETWKHEKQKIFEKAKKTR